MANAKACDVCGRSYVASGSGYKWRVRIKRRMWDWSYWSKFDICNNCWDEFKQWRREKRDAQA